MISIVIPTIPGREGHLAESKASYAAHTEDYELIVVPGEPACGPAWLKGALRAEGDYLHFSADDLCPHAGWAGAAIGVCDRGFLPAPRILNSDRSLQSCGNWQEEAPTGDRTDFTRIPFMSREQWEQIGPLVEDFLARSHYFTDNVISWAGRQLGIETGIHRGYLFTHHLAMAGRGAGDTLEGRMNSDWEAYQRYTGCLV